MSLRYMLDTDTVSYAMRGVGEVAKRLRARHPSSVCVSSLTIAQLRYGALKVKSKKLSSDVELISRTIQVVPFDQDAATKFGEIGVALAEMGKPIGTFDTLIASHGLALGLTVVTNNEKHFSLVPGLKIENWV